MIAKLPVFIDMNGFYLFHIILVLIFFYSVSALLVLRSFKARSNVNKDDAKKLLFVFGYSPFYLSLMYIGGLYLIGTMAMDFFIMLFLIVIATVAICIAHNNAMQSLSVNSIKIGFFTSFLNVIVPLIAAFITYNCALDTYSIGNRQFLGPWPYYRLHIYFLVAIMVPYATLMFKYSVKAIRAVIGFLIILAPCAFFPVPYYLQSRVLTREQYSNVYKYLYVDNCLHPAQVIDRLLVLGGDFSGINYIFAQTHGNDAHGNSYKTKISMHEFAPTTSGSRCIEEVQFSDDGGFFLVKSVPWPPY